MLTRRTASVVGGLFSSLMREWLMELERTVP